MPNMNFPDVAHWHWGTCNVVTQHPRPACDRDPPANHFRVFRQPITNTPAGIIIYRFTAGSTEGHSKTGTVLKEEEEIPVG